MPDWPISGVTFSQDKTGIVTFKVPWIVRQPIELVTFAPTWVPLGLPVVDRSGTNRTDGDWDLMLTHEGAVAGIKLEETFELDYTSTDEPIETFPKFDALAKKYKAKIVEDRLEGWPKTLKDDSGNQIKNPMYGVTHYSSPGATWTATRILPEFPSDLLDRLGKIASPRTNGRITPPKTPRLRNWLKRSVKASWRGNVWSVTESYLLSGDGGFIRDIYGANT